MPGEVKGIDVPPQFPPGSISVGEGAGAGIEGGGVKREPALPESAPRFSPRMRKLPQRLGGEQVCSTRVIVGVNERRGGEPGSCGMSPLEASCIPRSGRGS